MRVVIGAERYEIEAIIGGGEGAELLNGQKAAWVKRIKLGPSREVNECRYDSRDVPTGFRTDKVGSSATEGANTMFHRKTEGLLCTPLDNLSQVVIQCKYWYRVWSKSI